jgi:MYXO-CTERM domain-containing protein
MTLLALSLAATLGAVPTFEDARPLWAGSLQPASGTVVVSAAPGGLLLRSAGAPDVVVGGNAANALGAGLCPGASPRLAVPAGPTVFLLGPGSPASLVATVSLPAQAVSAAVPVVTSTGCRLAVALQSGDVVLVGPAGEAETLKQVIPAIADWHELPLGVLITSQSDLLVVGGIDGAVAAVRLSDGQRFGGTTSGAAIPGAVWADGEPTVWFLAKTGSLMAWQVTTGTPQIVQASKVGAPGGLVAWGGKTAHGIAWADMQGQVWAWSGAAVRPLVRLPAAVRWPMLVADLDDSGDLKLVAAVDGQVAALVTEDGTGGSFQLLPIAGRPMGAPLAYQLNVDSPPVLAIPAGPTRAAFHPADAVPAGQLAHDGAVLVSGSQLASLVPVAMHAALAIPAGTSGAGPGGTPGGTGGTGGTPTQTTPAKSGFGCSTAPASDALPLLLATLLLLTVRRPRRGSREEV